MLARAVASDNSHSVAMLQVALPLPAPRYRPTPAIRIATSS